MKKRILALLFAAVMVAALIPATPAKAAGGEINVYNWGQYISDGTDGYLEAIDYLAEAML